MKKFLLILLAIPLLIWNNSYSQSTYTSKVNGNYHTPSTWQCSGPCTNNPAIPNVGDDVVILHNVAIARSSNNNAKNITITSGALNFSSLIPYRLTIYGNLTINSTLNTGIGTIEFKNGSNQIISGSLSSQTFYKLRLTSSNVVLNMSADLIGSLVLDNFSTFDADGTSNNSVFRLLSASDDPTFDGGIGPLLGTSKILGKVTVQRYMSIEGGDNATYSNGRIYRYISSPVKNAPVSQIQVTIPVTGNFTGRSLCSGCGTNASLFYYNEAVSGNLNSGYLPFPVTTNTETFSTGLGYAIFVRGNIAPISTNGNALWSVRNEINSGTITYPVTYTNNGNINDDGWNLIGNPYPSTIDWNSNGWTKNGIGNSIYISNNEGTGLVYATYNGVVGTNGGTQYIATGQAFWVKATGLASINVNSNEIVKVPEQSTTFFKTEEITNVLKITLTSPKYKTDETVIHLRDDATINFDPITDAYKINNTTINVSSILNNTSTKLAINSLNELINVKLSITDVAAGSYSLNFNGVSSFNDSINVYLVDNHLDSIINVRNYNQYNFQITTDTVTYGNNRFYITFSDPAASLARKAEIYPNPVSDKLSIKSFEKVSDVKIYNLNGKLLRSFNNENIDISGLEPNIYVIIFNNGKTKIRKTFVKK